MADIIKYNFPFPANQTPAPYLGLYIEGKIFPIPTDHIKNFRIDYSPGACSAQLVLYDSFEMGRGRSHIDSDLMTLFTFSINEKNTLTKIVFGWQDGAKMYYPLLPTGLDYMVDDVGLNVTINLVPLGFVFSLAQGTFTQDITFDKIKKKDALTYINTIIQEYNRQAEEDYNRNKTQNKDLPKPVTILPLSLSDLKEAQELKGMDMSAVTAFSCSKLTFKDAMYKFFNEHLKSSANQSSAKQYFFELLPDEKNPTICRMIIYGISPLDPKQGKPVKRFYNIRCGGSTNVINISYKNNTDMMMFFTRIMDCFVSAVQVDPKKDKMEPVKMPDDKMCQQAKEMANRVLNNMPRIKKQNPQPGPSIKLYINMADKDFGNSTQAGIAAMQSFYQYWSLLSMPEIEIKVMGDPNFVIGDSIPDNKGDPQPVANNPDYVAIGDIIRVMVNNPNGQPNPLLCGFYIVQGFIHELDSGSFTTTIKAVKNGPLDEKMVF